MHFSYDFLIKSARFSYKFTPIFARFSDWWPTQFNIDKNPTPEEKKKQRVHKKLRKQILPFAIKMHFLLI